MRTFSFDFMQSPVWLLLLLMLPVAYRAYSPGEDRQINQKAYSMADNNLDKEEAINVKSETAFTTESNGEAIRTKDTPTGEFMEFRAFFRPSVPLTSDAGKANLRGILAGSRKVSINNYLRMHPERLHKIDRNYANKNVHLRQ